MTVGALNAQVVEQGESALVYYSPKTSVSLDFTYTVEKQEAGIFAAYAESLLGIDKYVKENKTTCTLTDVRIGTSTGTDYSRSHKVTADAGIPMLLNINDKGLLVGYNLPTTEKAKDKHAPAPSCERSCSKEETTLAVPYTDEVLKAATPLAQAHAVARQILHIRETRMYLLSGEVEKEPADGRAMKLVLEELDKQEHALTELFVGKTGKSIEHQRVVFDPQGQVPTLFFSEENGFTDADNIDADSISIQIALTPQQFAQTQEDNKSKKKKAVELSPIVYNLPGSGVVSVRYKDAVLGTRTIAIAQLGIDVPLSKDLFTGAELPTIVLNEKTGNIISISK